MGRILNLLQKLGRTQTGRWLGVYLAFPLVPPAIELTWRIIGGVGHITLEQVFPWTSLMAVFLMAAFVVKSEISKYNIPDPSEEDLADKGHARSRMESILMWLAGIFSCHVLMDTIVNIRGETDLYSILIGVRILSVGVLIWTFASFVAAQKRFKLKVAP
ncbi:MAG: hypothetical protein EOP84_33890 [Verrucomicrobiaceae bacterium]|nr:MAG: hypothetical protein EOP84_33890 [Verrucomicrobiaceae bacterium]